MKKQIVLTDDDIRQTLANSFNVDKKNVSLETYTDIVGYGMGESSAVRVKATVEVPMNEGR